jgi:hypothetical protein
MPEQEAELAGGRDLKQCRNKKQKENEIFDDNTIGQN